MLGTSRAAILRRLTPAARWMLLASAVFFLAALWLAARRSSPYPPVATVRQLMDVVVIPASKIVYGAVSTVSTAEGTVETVPKTDEEWRVVAANAAALAEAGALLTVAGRAHRGEAWMQPARALIDGAKHALAAAQAKDANALLEGGGEIAQACDNCHREYLPNGGR